MRAGDTAGPMVVISMHTEKAEETVSSEGWWGGLAPVRKISLLEVGTCT